jgi:hypothetical protein
VLFTRKLLYFTAANPSIDMGGFFGEHKDEILDLIPAGYKVKSILVKQGSIADFTELLDEHNFSFPIVLKPNVGERGTGVIVARYLSDLEVYALGEQDFLIQEYINFGLELGVLYSRLPNESEGVVSSITEKEFLAVVGDGVCTVDALLQNHPRHRIYYPLVLRDYASTLDKVPAKGELFVVHTIGNHIKGTRFKLANSHITPALNALFTQISNKVEGVYYGRYDLKVPSYEDLQEGRNIKIFELNGVSSEPGHIYDLPNVFVAYRDLAEHWFRLILISKQNIKKGVKTTPLLRFVKQVKTHFFG